MHDYTYYSQIFDMIDMEGTSVTFEGKNYKLDENDPVWQRVKYTHLGETQETLQTEINNFYKDQGGKIESSMTFDEILEKSQQNTKFKELMKLFPLHLHLSEEIFEKFRKQEIRELIPLEQQILSGMDSKGDLVQNKNIISGLTKLSKKLTREDHTRILLQYLVNYEFLEKDRYNLITSI